MLQTIIQIMNDDHAEERRQLVLELTDIQLVGFTRDFEVLVNQSQLKVVILDDDGRCRNFYFSLFVLTIIALRLIFSVLKIQFKDNEFSADESAGEVEIPFIISNPIDVDTHFLLRAMTYQQYKKEYENLSMTYRSLRNRTLAKEYDQAECEL